MKKLLINYLENDLKKDSFEKVELASDYRFKVIKTGGIDSFSTLSAGEGMTLAFSFIAALSSVASVYNPLVIDTPIARIDDDGDIDAPAAKVISSIASSIEGFSNDLAHDRERIRWRG